MYDSEQTSRLFLRSNTTACPEEEDAARMWATDGFQASEVTSSTLRERLAGEKGFSGFVRS